MEQLESPKLKVYYFFVTFILICFVATVFWIFSVLFRGYVLFDVINYHSTWYKNHLHTDANMVSTDKLRGYALTPNARGNMLAKYDVSAQFRHDDQGFRIRNNKSASADDNNSLWLFLGDSFTYGLLVESEEAFPYLIGEELKVNIINAGVPGYSLAQILVQAYEVIPQYKPDVVVVQYSPWLAKRALYALHPESKYIVSAPYFSANDPKGHIVSLNGPLFFVDNSIFNVHFDRYRWKDPKFINKLKFILNSNLFKYYALRDFYLSKYSLAKIIGIEKSIKATAENLALIEQLAYNELGRLAMENNAIMIVLGLGTAFDEINAPKSVFPDFALAINAWSIMVEQLNNKNPREYQDSYYFTRDDGYVYEVIDTHPTPKAHKIIADSVVGAYHYLQSRLDDEAASEESN